MEVRHRLTKLRQAMQLHRLDAYIIPSSDPHMSEYVADRWQGRQWISGFTGSAGTVVVTQEAAGLWTDGRYHIQAERQLTGTGIQLFKHGVEKVPSYEEWLADNLPSGSTLGVFGGVFSVKALRELERKLHGKKITLQTDQDLLEAIWEDRPSLPQSEVFVHAQPFAARSVEQKLDAVRLQMQKQRASHYLVTNLDDVAWLFNVRGSDVTYNPLFYAFGLVAHDEAWLFISKHKVPGTVEELLTAAGVSIVDYARMTETLAGLGEEDAVHIDPEAVSGLLFEAMPQSCRKVEERSIVRNLKAKKNDAEVANLQQCHIQDGVAMVQFLYWLDYALSEGEVTELTVEHKLEALRSQRENYMGPSFAPICAYKDHAAMMHYRATEASRYSLQKQGMLLVDSGGQYLGGTTDVTRTIVLGSISEQERRDFTLVLKGHINLATATFLNEATGSNLDVLARQPIWKEGINYGCGTGHGVGYFLCVHEGPHRMSQIANDVKLEKGMIITNEPGIYREGQHGIRTENEMLVVEDRKTEFGQFLRFEPITYCPIDRRALDTSLLTPEETEWLNNYHQMVYQTLSPLLASAERDWLQKATAAL